MQGPADTLSGGFAAPPEEGARAFRALLDAMARPGRVVTLAGAAPPAPASAAAGAALLVLTDRTTRLWLAPSHDTPALRGWIAFHTGAPVTADPTEADFALGDWAGMLPLGRFQTGTPEYPDRGATLIVDAAAFAGVPVRLTGPGIAGAARALMPDPAILAARTPQFPQGLDIIWTAGAEAMALPRSTKLEAI